MKRVTAVPAKRRWRKIAICKNGNRRLRGGGAAHLFDSCGGSVVRSRGRRGGGRIAARRKAGVAATALVREVQRWGGGGGATELHGGRDQAARGGVAPEYLRVAQMRVSPETATRRGLVVDLIQIEDEWRIRAWGMGDAGQGRRETSPRGTRRCGQLRRRRGKKPDEVRPDSLDVTVGARSREERSMRGSPDLGRRGPR